ncbi:AarF/ABC1/UbiB kinase family protein [Haloglomus irregulare]|uniref:AarF/ABC1/UbiB kinase family protein n=1 Tax=Haloglomus irregulare TaxID=2234134 RepID=A0A554NDH0_9EURY|nr:AarF/ABC1/UbiB kinase family protein [Haloglomus irregulare]TSD15434.1 AarF/ABC1/UbiB kinase family protein [Haloglomus irregulare]
MNLRAYRRFPVVVYQFLPILLAYARDRNRFLLFGRARQVDEATRRRRARKLLDSLLTLGPTFIKLGQILSTRPDILPPEYIEEFEQLQDRVPPADWADVRPVVEGELGPVSEAFESFDTDPISGASLGQVYTATVPDPVPGSPDGRREVAVKVRRPGIESLVEADLRIIKFSLPVLMRFVDQARSFSMQTLADEFSKTIREEMDYEREREMLEEIRGEFSDEPGVRIPAVDGGRSTGRVLTMEYVPGTKISDVDELDDRGFDRTGLAETLQRAYLKMLVSDGTFHADPHPGNLAVQDDGRLVFYDFGMSGRVDAFVQDKIVDFYVAVADQNIDAILDVLIELGTLSPEADREVMANVMELAIADARGEDIEQYRVQQIVEQVEDTIYEFPLRLPPNLALVLRVATVVEGVCVTLDPEFDFIDVATDYLREEGYVEASIREFLTDRADEVNDAARSALRTPPKLEDTLDRINRGDLEVEATVADEESVFDQLAVRLVLGLLLTGTVLAAAILYAFATPISAVAPAAGAALLLGLLYRSFREQSGISATPQFTRQEMRKRQEEP